MMTDQDKFTLLYDSLVDCFKGYAQTVMTILGSIIVAIGWILTSDKSRDFLRQSKSAYLTILTTVIILSILHVVVSVSYYYRSRKKFKLLRRLKKPDKTPYVPVVYYRSYKITPKVVTFNLVMNLSLFAALFMLIFRLR